MNFDVRISDAYIEFAKKEEKGKASGKQPAGGASFNPNDIRFTNGERLDYVDDQVDDGLYRCKAQKRINKKLKDNMYLNRNRERECTFCENFIIDQEINKPPNH